MNSATATKATSAESKATQPDAVAVALAASVDSL